MTLPFPRRLFPVLLAGVLASSGLGPMNAAESGAPGPMATEFPVATVAVLLRPLITVRVPAPLGGRFRLSVTSGPVVAGAVLGHFDDTELRATLDTARLRLRAAQQLETDFANETPQRRQEAATRISDLESRLALAEALAKNPALFRELPASAQAQLVHVDSAGLRAQIEAARVQLARLDAPDYAATSSARLQVLDAERAVREADTRLREAAVVAPIAGVFQPSPQLASAAESTPLGLGQEIGTLRDLTRLVAVLPAFSPYLVRVELSRTVLRVTGPGGKIFQAPFREAVTELTPVMGETRVFLYEFSTADSGELGGLVQTNTDGAVLLRLAQPVAVVAKLPAALDHPDAFRAGWAAGVPQAWPGWTLQCEGETALGLAPTRP